MEGARQFRCHPCVLVPCALCVFLPVGCLQEVTSQATSEVEELSLQPAALSAEVKRVLERKTRVVEELATQKRIVSAVRVSNEQNGDVTTTEIEERDARWRSTRVIDDFIKPFLTNDCAEALVAFQEEHDAFPELLVTDSRGLLVAASNKSSDYLQADESWWVAAMDDGRGLSHTGPIEYDESARSEAISIHVPILDPETGQAIGVIKAVCDVTAIKLEL